MHKQIISDREREILEDFLKTGNKREGFRMLKSLIKKNHARIQSDFELIEKAYKRL